MSVSVDGSNGITFNDGSSQTAAASPYGLKNRIINGDMRIDQRNAGASGTAVAYTVDRWQFNSNLTTKGTWQRNAGSVTPPAGFVNYLGFTSNSAYTLAASDYFAFTQAIEGFNVADLAWGTANAQTVTLSFWVYSSLTGTFGGALTNGNATRSYAFTYTISVANTWERKTVTIAGDTTGTWQTNNTIGLVLNLAFGVGSTFSASAGSWVGSNLVSATGATSVVGTNGATFYITGVQLEVGSTATPFERRMYGQELALCQRYCTLFSVSAINTFFGSGFSYNSVNALAYTAFPVPMRVSPTVTYSNVSHFGVYDGSAGTIVTTALTAYSSSPNAIGTRATVASGLTTGQGTMLKDNGTTSATIICNAEI